MRTFLHRKRFGYRVRFWPHRWEPAFCWSGAVGRGMKPGYAKQCRYCLTVDWTTFQEQTDGPKYHEIRKNKP